jgi:hypothetical protein
MDMQIYQSDVLSVENQPSNLPNVIDILYEPDEHVQVGDEREHRQITWSQYNGGEGFQLQLKQKTRRMVRNFAFLSRHGLSIHPTISYNPMGSWIDILCLDQPLALKEAVGLQGEIKDLLHGLGQILDPGCFIPFPDFEGGSGRRVSQAVMMRQLESLGV